MLAWILNLGFAASGSDAPEPEAVASGGGIRVATRKHRPYVTTAPQVPVSDELYRQMFPTAERNVARATKAPPLAALLAAWMAMDE